MRSYDSFAAHRNSQRAEDTAIVMDCSRSMRWKDFKPSRIKAAKNAVSAQLEIKRLHYPCDRIALIRFSSSAKVLCHPVMVRDGFGSLTKALKKAKAWGSTNITDGLKEAAGTLNQGNTADKKSQVSSWVKKLIYETPKVPDNKISGDRSKKIMLLSDGCHNEGEGPEDIAEEIKNGDVFICVVGIGGSPDAEEFDEELLKRIASRDANGDPMYCFIADENKLIREFESLAQHIKPIEE